MVFRLPTEAEWEGACRAGTDAPFWFGEKISAEVACYRAEYAWDGLKGTYRRKTTRVGSFRPNPWGLYDTAGNAWEWCRDWYAAYPGEARTDPRGPNAGSLRVLRGGSWYSSPGACRSAYRYAKIPAERDSRFGLRLLLEVPSSLH
jgi:formylglycine-generating enzyme required for sulfatase activity